MPKLQLRKSSEQMALQLANPQISESIVEKKNDPKEEEKKILEKLRNDHKNFSNLVFGEAKNDEQTSDSESKSTKNKKDNLNNKQIHKKLLKNLIEKLDKSPE